MKRAAQFMIGTLLAAPPSLAPAESQIEASHRHLGIGAVHDMSIGKPYGPPDKQFWEIVRLGKAAFRDLSLLVTDEILTTARVNYFGGHHAIGDIAVFALMEIGPDIPIVDWVDDESNPRFEEIGFNVYWRYVRAAPKNSIALQAKIRAWIAENESTLEWAVDLDHPAGGWYSIEAAKRESG